MKEKLDRWWMWYKQSSMLIGMPVMLILVCVGIQKFVFTGTCYTAGWKCEYAMYTDTGETDNKPKDPNMVSVPKTLMQKLKKENIIDWVEN